MVAQQVMIPTTKPYQYNPEGDLAAMNLHGGGIGSKGVQPNFNTGYHNMQPLEQMKWFSGRLFLKIN